MVQEENQADSLLQLITKIISETNGITLEDSLELMLSSYSPQGESGTHSGTLAMVREFHELLNDFHMDRAEIRDLLVHPVARALHRFFKAFPLPYREQHIHLTGSLSADFIFPRLVRRLEGPGREFLESKIRMVYGPDSLPIRSPADIDRLIRLKDNERFDRYLQILMLPKLILVDRDTHSEAAYHMARELYHRYNVGHIRLKFMLSRATGNEIEQVPGLDRLTPEDIAVGLYDGFSAFKREQPAFDFILSPCFRKESDFFDKTRFSNKREDVMDQINTILDLIERHPFLQPHLCEVDTVGNERDFYRKKHFYDMYNGFRKLQYYGFKIRSHHGETWKNLRSGIQAVDNAMNIWHIDTLEHGLSLGINPNYYFHSLAQRVLKWNDRGEPVRENSPEYHELVDMLWNDNESVLAKLLRGETLDRRERVLFTKAKFHTATEVEHYQHDVLNRMIHKNVSLMSLPSSNTKLTQFVADYKDHPFSWWEKKGVELGVGTDNYVTLNTDFIQEMLILLFTDPTGLKITKLLMVTTGETRRPYISHLLWKMNPRD